MTKNITDEIMTPSQQNKVMACLPVHTYLQKENSYIAQWEFVKQNHQGEFTHDFGDNS